MIYVFDYATLKVIWWLLVGLLLIGFAILDGMDLGIGTLLPIVARTDDERRVVLNTVGPTWEGNQVWFITAGGATFAAWPLVYATAFSGFYVALILVLFALFMRPVGFDNEYVLRKILGVSQEETRTLYEKGVLGKWNEQMPFSSPPPGWDGEQGLFFKE